MEAITKIRDLKNKFAQEAGYEDWYDYLNYCKSNGFDESEIGYDDLIQFCCRHYVQQALKQASEKVQITDFGYAVNKDSILNAYSLENIK